MPHHETLATLATSPADYERFGLLPSRVALWEDGARTDNRSGSYEWWYFDAHLDDGSKLVVIFMNKDLATPDRPLSPILRVNLDLPDGRSYQRVVPFPAQDWSAAADWADVRLGANRFTGDLAEYRIQATAGEVSVDVTLTGQIPPWRPATGHMLFGPERDLEFAWLPSVPQGIVTGSYTVDGVTRQANGVGYHDHNWGNVGIMKIIHDWYWARGQAGQYSVIASFITAQKKYGYQTIPLFMLARNGHIVADDASLVRFETEGVYTDETTGKPVATVGRYAYEQNDDRIVVSFTRERNLARERMVDALTWPKRLAAKLARFDGAYLRFTGPMAINVYKAGILTEQHSQDAIWELMYFGHSRPPSGA